MTDKRFSDDYAGQADVRIGHPEKLEAGLSYAQVAERYGLPISSKGLPDAVSLAGSDGGPMSVFWDYSPESGQLFYAASLPSKMSDSQTYLQKVRDLEAATTDSKTRNQVLWDLYKFEGYVGNCVDTLIDNCILDNGYVMLSNEDEEVQKMLEAWLKSVNGFNPAAGSKIGKDTKVTTGIVGAGGIEGVFKQCMLHLLVLGDWVASVKWENVLVEETGKKYNLPTRITTLNFDELEPSKEAAAAGLDIIEWNVPRDIVDAVKGKTKDDPVKKIILESLPDWVKKEINAGKDKIMLPPKFTVHLKRRERDYSATGFSYVDRFLQPLADKNRLRWLDRSTIAGLIQRLTIVTMGHDDPNHPLSLPDPARFNLLQTALRKLKTDHFKVWGGSDIKVIDIGPDGKVLGLKERYAEVNDDMGRASGIPEVLTSGSASGSPNTFTLLNTIAKVEDIRMLLKRWTERLLLQILTENGKKDIIPTYQFRITPLRDERTVKSSVLKAWEDGVLPRVMTLHELGYNGRQVIELHLAEKASGIDEKIGPPPVAYSTNRKGEGQINDEPGRPDGSSGTPKRKKDEPEGADETKTEAFVAAEDDQPDDYEREDNPEIEDDIVAIKAVFMTMIDSIMAALRLGEEDIKKYVVAGFAAFQAFTDDLIMKYLDAGLSAEYPMTAQALMAWNAGYVVRFRSDLFRNVDRIMSDINIDPEAKILAIQMYLLALHDNRAPMYVEEIGQKCHLANKLMKMKQDGSIYVSPVTAGDDKVCEACMANEGVVMTLDDFLATYPMHNHCRCEPVTSSGTLM